jgi:hypothetical protein
MNWKNFKFVARKDTWFVSDSICDCVDGWENIKNSKLTDFVGDFNGYTNETYTDYKGELPRYDGEICPFEEFDIFYDGILVNNYTINEIKVLDRKRKLNK